MPTAKERAARYEQIREELKGEPGRWGGWTNLSEEGLHRLFDKCSSFFSQVEDHAPGSTGVTSKE